jgi:hypothetical protein
MGAGVRELAFSRLRYADFQQLIAAAVDSRPALVLIDGDPAERHIDYVVNDPDLAAEVLFGRLLAGGPDSRTIARQFPNRTVYIYRERGSERSLERVPAEAH